MRVVLAGLLVAFLGVLAPQHSAVAAHEVEKADSEAKADPPSLGFSEKISDSPTGSHGKLGGFLNAQLGLDTAEIWAQTRVLGGKVQSHAQNFAGHVQGFAGHAHDFAGQRIEDVKVQFRDTTAQISAFQETLADAVSAANVLRADIVAYMSKDASQEDREEIRARVEAEFGNVLERVMEEMRTQFAHPDHAPSHAEREEMVDCTLGKVNAAMRDMFKGLGVGEGNVERLARSFEALVPLVKKFLVVVGDLAEQHPQLLKTLLFSAATFVVPQAWILGKLLSIFGFGALGPVKGTAAAWAQRVFFGAMIPQGSWFAKLQKLGMTLL